MQESKAKDVFFGVNVHTSLLVILAILIIRLAALGRVMLHWAMIHGAGISSRNMVVRADLAQLLLGHAYNFWPFAFGLAWRVWQTVFFFIRLRGSHGRALRGRPEASMLYSIWIPSIKRHSTRFLLKSCLPRCCSCRNAAWVSTEFATGGVGRSVHGEALLHQRPEMRRQVLYKRGLVGRTPSIGGRGQRVSVLTNGATQMGRECPARRRLGGRVFGRGASVHNGGYFAIFQAKR